MGNRPQVLIEVLRDGVRTTLGVRSDFTAGNPVGLASKLAAKFREQGADVEIVLVDELSTAAGAAAADQS